jgi:hypothetical protein
MADPAPKRWVLVTMIHAAIERTEEEIAELKAAGLFVRDASGPGDSHAADVPAAPKPPPPAPAPAAVKAGG